LKLAGLETRAEHLGQRAAAQVRDRIIRRANLPNDIRIEAANGGIVITAKRLRRRMIDDPTLRNFAHE
jgi:hypothetical protein